MRLEMRLWVLDDQLSRIDEVPLFGGATQPPAVLGPMIELQAERLRLFKIKHSPSPRLTVDGLTVALLAASGIDPVEVLRRFRTAWSASVELIWDGVVQTMYLNSKGRHVYSSMTLDRYCTWCDGKIHFERLKRRNATAAVGQPAASISDHPAFADRTIVKVERFENLVPSYFAHVDAPTLRFDAGPGTLTPMRHRARGKRQSA